MIKNIFSGLSINSLPDYISSKRQSSLDEDPHQKFPYLGDQQINNNNGGSRYNMNELPHPMTPNRRRKQGHHVHRFNSFLESAAISNTHHERRLARDDTSLFHGRPSVQEEADLM